MHRLFCTVSMVALMGLAACQPQNVPEAPKTPISEKEKNFLRLGRNVEKGGDIDSAIDLYKQAIDADSTGIEGHLALSRVYLEQGHRVQAKDVLLDAKKSQPTHPEVNLRLGKIAVHRNLPDEALVYFNDGLRELPGNVDLLNGRGIALDMMGRHAEAQISYRQSLNDSNEPFVENNLAMSYIMTGKYDEAIHILEGVKNIGDSPVMRQNLALAYGLKGDMIKAREWGGKGLNEAEMAENIAFYQEYLKDLEAQHDQSVPVAPIASESIHTSPKALAVKKPVPLAAPATPPAATIPEPASDTGFVEKIVPAETIATPLAPAALETVPLGKPPAAVEEAPAAKPAVLQPFTAPAITPKIIPVKPEGAVAPKAPIANPSENVEPEIAPLAPPVVLKAAPPVTTDAPPPAKPVAPPHWRTLPWMTGAEE